jgi:hypothetical protein
VVMMAKLRTRSPAGERQLSHNPANAIRMFEAHTFASAFRYRRSAPQPRRGRDGLLLKINAITIGIASD